MASNPIKYKKGYKYVLAEDYICHIDIYPTHDIKTDYVDLAMDGTLTIKKYYAWDGTSGPTLDGKTNMRGSLIHDSLYGLFREEHLSLRQRKQADLEFQKACLEDGMCKARAWIDFVGLRHFGASCASPENDREVLIAP
jgi:hypothetical protein